MTKDYCINSIVVYSKIFRTTVIFLGETFILRRLSVFTYSCMQNDFAACHGEGPISLSRDYF